MKIQENPTALNRADGETSWTSEFCQCHQGFLLLGSRRSVNDEPTRRGTRRRGVQQASPAGSRLPDRKAAPAFCGDAGGHPGKFSARL